MHACAADQRTSPGHGQGKGCWRQLIRRRTLETLETLAAGYYCNIITYAICTSFTIGELACTTGPHKCAALFPLLLLFDCASVLVAALRLWVGALTSVASLSNSASVPGVPLDERMFSQHGGKFSKEIESNQHDGHTINVI